MSIEEKIKTAKEDGWLKDSVSENEFKEIKDKERKMSAIKQLINTELIDLDKLIVRANEKAEKILAEKSFITETEVVDIIKECMGIESPSRLAMVGSLERCWVENPFYIPVANFEGGEDDGEC